MYTVKRLFSIGAASDPDEQRGRGREKDKAESQSAGIRTARAAHPFPQTISGFSGYPVSPIILSTHLLTQPSSYVISARTGGTRDLRYRPLIICDTRLP